MSKLTDRVFARVGRVGKLAALALLALVLPLTVFSGLSPSENKDVEPEAAKEAPSKAAASGHQIRCWQQGQLILEENNLEVPGDAIGNSLALRAADRSPVYLLDTLNSTCLIKKPGDEQDKAARNPY
jgi:hypothetical protein